MRWATTLCQESIILRVSWEEQRTTMSYPTPPAPDPYNQQYQPYPPQSESPQSGYPPQPEYQPQPNYPPTGYPPQQPGYPPQQPGYPPTGYMAPGAQPNYPQQYPTGMGPTNGFAIASLVCSIVGIGLLGVIFGHVSLSQINNSNGYQQGRGLALAGLIIGYIEIGLVVLYIVFVIIAVIFAANAPTN